jgi:hypothetical protein
MSSALCRWYN